MTELAQRPLSILAAAQQYGSRPFVVLQDTTLSFAEVASQVRGALCLLTEAEVQPGQSQPVPFNAENTLTSVVLLLALLELGVPALLLHPRWSDVETARALKSARLRPLELPAHFVPLSEQAWPAREHSTPPEAPLAVVYTSGSTKDPKGVVLSRRAFEASAAASASNLGWEADDRWLLSLPLAHVGGLSVLVRCLIARRAVVLPSSPSSADANPTAQLYETLVRHSVTLLSLVPTQLQRLLALKQPCPASLRAVLLGGAPASEALLRRALDARYPVLTTYGLTECCSQVTTQSAHHLGQYVPGAGLPLGGTELRLQQGRIAVRSESLLSGYFLEPDTALTPDGFFVTQDAGMIDDAGQLHVLGRIDDVIVSGGENVHPEEVEACLLEHPSIEAACVFGLDDAEFGQRVSAAIVGSCSEAELQRHLKEQLSGFKRPKSVAWVDQLPLTASGKVSRRAAAQKYAERCRPL